MNLNFSNEKFEKKGNGFDNQKIKQICEYLKAANMVADW